MERLYASEDTYALSDEDTPHGSVNTLAVITDATHTAYSYISFDLAGWIGKTLDEGNGAILKLYISSNELTAPSTLRFRRITEGWSESTLIWSNRPDVEDRLSKRIFQSDSGWISYNITRLIQDILTIGEGCCGVRVDIDAGVLWYSSSEGSRCPKLELTEAEAIGDIVSGYARPASQDAGGLVEAIATVRNRGNVGGYFHITYYEGGTHLRTLPRVWLAPGETIPNLSEPFTMPNYDYSITIKIINAVTGRTDDALTVTCFLLASGEYYVKTDGSDTHSGTSWTNAWRTMDKAARTIPDGSTLHIGFGNYVAEPARNKIAPQNIGPEGILYKPETPGGTGGVGAAHIKKNA